MKKLIFICFCLVVPFSGLHGQFRKIDLKEVEVAEKSIPIVTILGRKYSFRNRDYFVKRLLKQDFWSEEFHFIIDLSDFYRDSIYSFEMKGKTMVKVDDEILEKGHQYGSNKVINELLSTIKKVNIIRMELTAVKIKTK